MPLQRLEEHGGRPEQVLVEGDDDVGHAVPRQAIVRSVPAGGREHPRDGIGDVDGRRGLGGRRREARPGLGNALTGRLAPMGIDLVRGAAGQDPLERPGDEVADPGADRGHALVVGLEAHQPGEPDVALATRPEVDRDAERGERQVGVEAVGDRPIQVTLVLGERGVGRSQAVGQRHHRVRVRLVTVRADPLRAVGGVRRDVDQPDRPAAPIGLPSRGEERIHRQRDAAGEEGVDAGRQEQEHRAPVPAADRSVAAELLERRLAQHLEAVHVE